MKYFFIIFFVSFGLIFSISCSESVLYEDNLISVSKYDSNLKITNRDDKTVYYFIVERNTAALINWAPTTKGNKILSGNTVTIEYKEIYGLQNQTIQEGTKVIFYYWNGSDDKSFNVKNVVIDL